MERKNKSNNGMSSDAVNAVMLGLDGDLDNDTFINDVLQAKNSAVKPSKPQPITEFSELQPEQVFSTNAYYKLYNRDSMREFIINGLVLESRVGLDSALREKMLSRSAVAFRLDNSVAKFYCYKM